MATFFISSLLWPMLLPGHLRVRRFERDLETGKRPKWLVLDDGERTDEEWTLSDGTTFSADSTGGGSSLEQAVIWASFEGGDISRIVECRVRKIAPEAEDWTEWKRMKVKRPTFDPESESEPDNEPFYETSLKLQRGKYYVSFRVHSDAGVEERGNATLIVADPDEYL